MSTSDDPDRGEGFLSRWSRRKRTITTEGALAPPPAVEAVGEPPAEEPFDVSLLPDIESLTAESDITLFLKKGVPEALKNAAMRKIWSADPAIRDFIGPVDYQWDFNDPAGVPGFGPLGADVDVQALLRQVMGEKPAAPPVVEGDPEPPGLAGEPRSIAPTEASDLRPTEAPDPVRAEGTEKISFSQESRDADANSAISPHDDADLPQKPRRHGGALPV